MHSRGPAGESRRGFRLPSEKGVCKLARRPNYNYEKRQKEIKRAKKKQQKLEEKRARKASESGEVAANESLDTETEDIDTVDDEQGAEPIQQES